MITQIIAVLILLYVLFTAAFSVYGFYCLIELDMFRGYLRTKWQSLLMRGGFAIVLLVNAVGLLLKLEWAVPATRYAIVFWLVYIWLKNLMEIFVTVVLLNWEKAKTISQLMGCSKFFEETFEKNITMSKQPDHQAEGEEVGDAGAGADSLSESLMDDDFFSQEEFLKALRMKLRVYVIVLLTITVIFVIMLVLMR